MSSPTLLNVLSLLFGLVVGAIAATAVTWRRSVAVRANALQLGHNQGRVECEVLLKPEISGLKALLDSSEKCVRDREEELRGKKQDESVLIAELIAAKELISELKTNLDNEIANMKRRQIDEEALSNRFAKLSQAALSANSGEFIKLARSTFEREQEEARGS